MTATRGALFGPEDAGLLHLPVQHRTLHPQAGRGPLGRAHHSARHAEGTEDVLPLGVGEREPGGRRPEDRRCFRARPAAPGAATSGRPPRQNRATSFFPGKEHADALLRNVTPREPGESPTEIGYLRSGPWHGRATVQQEGGAFLPFPCVGRCVLRAQARCRCSLRAGWPWAVITRNGVDRLERVRFLPNVALSADGNLPDSSRCVNSDLKRSQKQAQPQPRRQRTFPRTSIRRHAIRGHAEQALQVRQRRRYQK